MSHQPQGRQAKSKSRIDQFYELSEVAKTKVVDDTKLELLSAGESRRLGGVVVNFEDVSYFHDDNPEKILMQNFSYNILRNDRIGIVGANG
jgi:ATP-binding cassette subfamily F protein uup